MRIFWAWSGKNKIAIPTANAASRACGDRDPASLDRFLDPQKWQGRTGFPLSGLSPAFDAVCD